MSKKQARVRSKTESPVVRVVKREIPQPNQLQLYVRAGGRCEFDGCNRFLLEHPLTKAPGNFGQLGHIVAFSLQGPRGYTRPRPRAIHSVDNLMLLCPNCHHLIDTNAQQYSVSTLRAYKNKHEDRIRHVTGLGPDRRTTVVQLKAKIAGQSVDVPINQVTDAVAPLYPTDARGTVIDLTTIHAGGQAFMETACQTIDEQLSHIYAPGMDAERTRHISLFALAPIPLLVFLGSRLSNKIPADLFQRHRDTENWVWKTSGHPVKYQFQKLQSGTDNSAVALILSLSGKIPRDSLPQEIGDTFSIYEITLKSQMPSPIFLRRRDDLDNFKIIYQEALRTLGRDHGLLTAIHLFPAVPAPIAVLCGRELLPKVDPALFVYDYDKATGGFNLIWRINHHE